MDKPISVSNLNPYFARPNETGCGRVTRIKKPFVGPLPGQQYRPAPIDRACCLMLFYEKIRERGLPMLTASKILLIIAGILLVLDAIFMFGGLPNPLFGLPLPCPLTLLLLGVGIILFVFSSKAFKKG